jgi:hypothetical protein
VHGSWGSASQVSIGIVNEPALICLAYFGFTVMECLNFLTEMALFDHGLGLGINTVKITLVEIPQNENLVPYNLEKSRHLESTGDSLGNFVIVK